ncbi:hypothetical protein N7468_000537 [Penicillium chermesinum]|uniref:Mg2+ transporter protein, CorA-like/Zinc transport protein ZntB n=1 Tax=Penicillium chermesinum TaxID=63820 RepID=A0A9W9PKH3_9EURO|nr:uncharacterized protein N7468_000537 [Penicillium chermesinum]KAJ5249086.1 hypothetical protein N7468_000537 [Penicillium chermesinum]KAJ6151190.1 hypothetical protein N7470_007784 [Penicillium chermesinum]
MTAVQIPPFHVQLWNEENGWRDESVSADGLSLETPFAIPTGIPSSTQVFVITVDAKKVWACQETRQVIQHALRLPDICWANYLANANGYFGCDATDTEGEIDGFNTWAFFEVKHLLDKAGPNGKDYRWFKIGIFSRWLPSTHQTGILLLSSDEHMSSFSFKPSPGNLIDPFWLYPCILGDIARLQETAIWNIRNEVRKIETKRQLSGESPQPHYERLHEIARHAIHVSESIDVTVRNLQEIVSQHQMYTSQWNMHPDRFVPPSLREAPENREMQKSLIIYRSLNRRLQFFLSHIESIGHRAKANEKRLQNEIQLAFNLISQRDTAATVQIGEAAQRDSATMKTLSFITLIFLPPTFISTIFGMQFFNYDSTEGFVLTSDFWIYWAIAIPITMLTGLVWLFWSKIFPHDSRTTFERIRHPRHRHDENLKEGLELEVRHSDGSPV